MLRMGVSKKHWSKKSNWEGKNRFEQEGGQTMKSEKHKSGGPRRNTDSVQMGWHSSRFTQYDYFRLFVSFSSFVKSYRNLSCVTFFVRFSFPVSPPQLQALSKLSNDDNARMASAPVASSGLYWTSKLCVCVTTNQSGRDVRVCQKKKMKKTGGRRVCGREKQWTC